MSNNQLNLINEFIKDEKIEKISDEKYDYIVDAIDTVAKSIFHLSCCAKRAQN